MSSRLESFSLGLVGVAGYAEGGLGLHGYNRVHGISLFFIAVPSPGWKSSADLPHPWRSPESTGIPVRLEPTVQKTCGGRPRGPPESPWIPSEALWRPMT